ncbi:MAG: 3-deoxy-D-manno-octulosonic acid transferase [Gammaproteobacteria bacterium]|nr:3-deoxy-D-manno-octulosonic acid transferase [Gammaproteobacteria bacterium]
MSGLWRLSYTLLLYLASPILMARLYWRGRKAPAYRQRWAERWGFGNWRSERPTIWIHAVSVGEVMAALPLARAILEKHPDYPLIVTTTTPTGSDRVVSALGTRAHHVYMPYDMPGPIRRFIRRTRPALLIVMETEIWPNLFHACKRKGVALILANARLSRRSADRYARFRGLVADTLSCCSRIAAQGAKDAERFVRIGAHPELVTETGNIKFDFPLPEQLDQNVAALRALWHRDVAHPRPVLLAASTHEGEEEQILEAFAEIRRTVPDLLLVIAPRHPERFGEVAELCGAKGYHVVKRSASRNRSTALECEIFLGDTMGELLDLYAAADLTFVGGSLIPRGGHNVIEPAALRCPILFGPHMFNFSEVSRNLLQAEGAIQVSNAQSLARETVALLHDPQARALLADRAYAVFESSQGALPRTMALIAETLGLDRPE